MKSLVLTHQYPKKDNLYRSGFIHQRVKEYINNGIDTEIWVLDDEKSIPETYVFEGVIVFEGNSEAFISHLEKNEVGKILVHFLKKSTIKALNLLKLQIPIIVWVHLFEASSWHRRLFDCNNVDFLKYIKNNIIQLRSFKRFNENTNLDVTYVFVSKWIKEIAEKDINTTFKNSYVIHNYINEDLYQFSSKTADKRKKILSIRTFQSKKYGNDISAKVIKILSQKPEFKEMEFALYGKGKYFNKIQKELAHFPNVKLHDNFLSQDEIAQLHKEYGVFLCPTRQDSQGVSMCEAMSSGLVAVTSNNSAIPEFVINNKTGLLGNNADEIANLLLFLYQNPGEFTKISEAAAIKVREQCGLTATIQKEIQIILKDNLI
ncbi:glycosyltransferase family 4 protein [Metabacillus indicus]|uniref:Glycosyl transferase family 1 domain-containing protein n=1 Tax=Metabacillus indicus TaxID=246786 RepID=A0A084GXY7_METID|nr:glycosyltransferase family 4 protein [Metabacillus indicus]KEZ52199.1 hypothetical protein GS18_0214095 [Metabacillus indicus]